MGNEPSKPVQCRKNLRFFACLAFIYNLSMEELPQANDSLDQSFKVLSMDVHGFPIGFLDVLLPCGTYGFSYVFKGEEEIICDSIERFQQFEPLMQQSDRGVQLTDQCLRFVQSLYESLTELMEFNQVVDQFIRCTSAFYWLLKETYPIARNPKVKVLAEGIRHYQEIKASHISLTEFSLEQFEVCLNHFPPTTGEQRYDLNTGRYISALMNMREDLRNSFFKEDSSVMIYHCMEASKTIQQFGEYLKNEMEYSSQLLHRVFCNTEDGLITELLRAFVEISQNDADTAEVLNFIDHISDKFKSMVTWFEEKHESSLGINLNKLSILLENLKPANQRSVEESVSGQEDVSYEFIGSMNRILEFSGIEAQKKEFFKNFIEHYKQDRPRIEQIPKETKRKVNDIFFELYEAVLIRFIKEEPKDKVLDMFLLYGFVDSDLLLPQQVRGLYNLMHQYDREGNIYSIKSWLTQVLSREKSPSVNELGIPYAQCIKEVKYRNTQDTGLNTGEHRLHYEITNMFRTNHRVCSGHSSTYFPVLHDDMLPEDIQRVAVTPKRIRESLQEILEKDYSAFHREVFYSGDNEVFQKEIIMKQVLPEIILLPVVGTRGIMWQEISGPSKSSPGRFIIPMLTSEDLTLMLIKIVGQFRWELCRSIMGVRWNDVSYNCLTSTYSDYIENYKKNKNLTPDMKEWVRTQTKRYKNNLRNIFASDYEMWLRYEYQGMRKLNKEVRAILHQFCPFQRSKREEFMKQPALTDIVIRYENERKKVVREIETRYAYYVKRGHALEPELEEHLRLLKEM
jgi:hypothetical protein